MKIRATMIASMNQSSQNSASITDASLYANAAIEQHNLLKSVSTFAAYYCFMCCCEHSQIDHILK
jgi:hypothetical protein